LTRDPLLLSAREAAVLLGIHEKTFRRRFLADDAVREQIEVPVTGERRISRLRLERFMEEGAA
jgi:hypothetical protein